MERLDLIGQISRELQSRYTYTQIDAFLMGFKISTPREISANSKRVYSEAALQSASDETILTIAAELELFNSAGATVPVPPENWKGTSDFRLFISHVAKDKDKAKRLKICLERYAISGFVAHEDILPTLAWQAEVERALKIMDGFIAIHTPGFARSVWTQQEIGFALGRGVKIISFSMGEDPAGFIAGTQALPRRNRTAEQIAVEVHALLSGDQRTSAALTAAKLAQDYTEDIPF